MSPDFTETFARLRAIMLDAAPDMKLAVDTATNLTLRTHWQERRTKQPAWFGMVEVKKTYVSFHLMPLYTLPALNALVPAELEARRQGKTCFNFKTVDEARFESLRTLTATASALEPALRAAIGIVD